jgi:E3 ubiquitin-protein ligase HERC1
MHKRITLFKRIFFAISNKYHEKSKAETVADTDPAPAAAAALAPVSSSGGSEALVEMGVRTGLSLLFSLLRQNWALSSQLSTGFSLCNDVLQTALGVLQALPPLSLSAEAKLPALGVTSLRQITNFLKTVSQPQSGADAQGRRLSCELLLLLCVQRASLSHLLEWVEMALCAAATNAQSALSLSTFLDCLAHMSTLSPSAPPYSTSIPYCSFRKLIQARI